MSLPLASIYTTSYNQEKYIRDAVLSAVKQDYDPLQIVVSDDASTDNSPKILKELAAQYPIRLEIILNKKNMGITKNHKIAMSQCKGKYIACLDGDDVFLPGKIRKQVEFMEAKPDCIISYHDCEVVDIGNGRKLFNWVDRFGKREGRVETLVRYGPFMCSATVMARREFVSLDGYVDDMTSGADWLLWIQTLANGKGNIRYFDDTLAKYRRHHSNITLNWKAKLDSRFYTLDLIEQKYPQLRSVSNKYRSDLFLMRAAKSFSRHEYFLFSHDLIKALYNSSPLFWNILRIPIRELFFYFKNGMKQDDLIKSLFSMGVVTNKAE